MLNKKDPLIDAIQQVMQSNQADRDAVKAVNEKFGIQDRRVLPRERQGEWDAAYSEMLNEASSPPMYNVVHKEHGIIGTHQHGKGFTPSKPKLGFKSGEVPSGAKIDHSSRVGAGGMMNKSISKTKKSMDEEALEEKTDPSKYSEKQRELASTAGNKKVIDGPDLTHVRKHGGKHIGEAKKMKGDDPCWDNYEMIGMKKGKGGKEVPNCVPVKEQMTDPYAEGQASSISTVKSNTPVPKPRPTSITQGQKDALTNKIKSIKEAKKAAMCESNNEDFNGRHDSSVTASADKQVVVDQLNERVSFSPADQKARGNIVKDINSTNARLAREPTVAPSSIGTKVGNAVSAVDAGVRKFAQGMGGDYVAAAGDYAVKNVGAKLGIGQGTTYAKELEQEKEKSRRAELNQPTATKIGKAADDISTVAGIAGLGKGVVKYGAKKLIQKSTDDAVAATTKTLPKSAPVKSVSQAAREPASTAAAKTPTAVDNFISKAKSTPVSAAAREGGSAATTAAKPVSAAAREGGDAGAKAAANVSKYTKPSTAGGRFSDNLAKARKGSENYGPSKGGVAVRKTTEPATVTRPGVPAVSNRPGVPAVANRPGLPATVGSAATKVAGRTSNLKDIGTKAAVGLGVGAAMYGLSNKNKPDSAGATPATATSGGSAKPSVGKPVTAKPTSAKPVAASPAASAVKSRLQTRDQRDNTIGASGKSTKGPGGVTSGTKTGKTITNGPVVGKKAPVGTGRVK